MKSLRLLVLGLAPVLGCDQSTLVGPPDAGGEDACVPQAALFCDAAPPDAAACSGGDPSDPNGALLPTDAAFPLGCTANIVSDVRDTVTGFCSLAATCTCADDDAGPRWTCTP